MYDSFVYDLSQSIAIPEGKYKRNRTLRDLLPSSGVARNYFTVHNAELLKENDEALELSCVELTQKYKHCF